MRVTTNHSLMTLVRSSSEAESLSVLRQATEPLERFQDLNDLLKSTDEFEPVFVNDLCPHSA